MRLRTVSLLAALLAVACEPAVEDDTASTDDPVRPAFAVFPSHDRIVDGRLVLGDLPFATTPVPAERLAWRDGFSPVQTTVVQLGVALDPDSLPGLDAVGEPGSVQLWDLDDGAPIPCFAEIDAWPAPDGEPRALLIRPQVPVAAGHRVAAVLTSSVRTADGSALTSPDWFEAQRDDEHYTELLDTLTGLGVDDVVLAEDWTVATDPTAPLATLFDALATPTTYTFDEVQTEDLVDGMHTRIEGGFTTTNWLADDVGFVLDDEGLPTVQGTTDARLYVYIPDSLADAPDGSAPVWMFGHGIFANPDVYLDAEGDPSAVVELANRAGAVVIATVWRGLTSTDLAVPVTVGSDFGRLPELTDKLGQGVANTVALARLVTEGPLLDDPLLSVARRDQLSWMGISLGGIHGPIVVGQVPDIDHAVLHVGGSTWSTMLERSSNWSAFESLLELSLPDPGERQLLYSVSQLWWDPTDPVNWASTVQDRSVLWQVALGDDQVPNLTTWTMARAVGAPLSGPVAVEPFGLETVAAGGMGPAVTQFDPQTFNHEIDNRPSPTTEAHTDPRSWEACKQQTLTFLDPRDGGIVEHTCDGVCTPPE